MYSLEEMLTKLDRLDKKKQPKWGTMNAQQMVEHLSDTFRMASGKISFPMEVPASAIDKMRAFLSSDKPMAKNIQVAFAPENTALRNEELELAIDEFAEEWIDFMDTFEEHPTKTTCHPYYGELSFELWMQLHKKHVLHHFEQFELINV